MKKIIFLILIFFTSISFINLNLQASEINLDGYTEMRADNVFGSWIYSWEINDYYFRSEKVQLNMDYLDLDFINRDLRPVASTPLYFQYPFEITGSKLEVYQTLESTTPLVSYDFIDSGNGLLGDINQTIDIDDTLYYQLKIKMHPKTYSYGMTGVYQVISELMNLANQDGLTNDYPVLPVVVKSYSIPSELNPDDVAFISSLPVTPGSIYNDPHLMYDVTVENIGYNVTFTINNNGSQIQFTKTFAPGTDFSIFNDNYEIKYYTYMGDYFIVFNHGSESLFYISEFDSSPFIPAKYPSTFIPYTIWNIETNEISTVDKFDVYLYAKEEDSNNVYGYFYVDQFVIDNLLSVTTTIEYRYKSIIGTVGDWTTISKVLEDTTINPGNIDWKLSAAAISSTATILGSMIPGIGLPLLIIGTPISLYLQYLSYQELIDGNLLWTGSIDEIQMVTPSADLLQEVNASYQAIYPGFTGIDTTGTFKLWKLHIGTFNKPFQSNIEFSDENGISIMQMKYQTDGMLYTISEDEMDLNFNPGELSEKEPNPPLFDFSILGKYGTLILIGGGIFVLFAVLPTIEKGYKSAKRVISNPKLMIVIALIVIGVLIYLGTL